MIPFGKTHVFPRDYAMGDMDFDDRAIWPHVVLKIRLFLSDEHHMDVMEENANWNIPDVRGHFK